MKKMAKRSRRNDYGVKGMKKGQHLKAQEPQPSTSQKPSKPAPNPVAMERLKNAGIAVGQKRGLLTRLKEGYKANRAIGREMAAGGRKLGAAILFNPIASANRAAGTALHIRNFEKKHGLGDASYRDSLVVMAYRKRQLRDAKSAYIKARKRSLARRDASIRRYNDADLKAMVQQLKSQFIKIKDGLKQFAKDHPSLTRILKVLGAFIIMVSTESPETAKEIKKYQIKRTLEEGIIDLERENNGSFGMSKIPNKYMIGLRFCIALVGKIIGVALIVSAARRNKKTDSRCRRDSKAMLVIAKRRYRDALRRYQDSVLDTLKQKFDIVFQKIKKTVKEYIKAFPLLSSLTASLMSMSSVYTTYGVVAGAPKVLSYLQYQSKIIDQSDFSVYGKAGLKARNVLIALYAVATKIIKAIIKLKIAKGISQTLQEK